MRSLFILFAILFSGTAFRTERPVLVHRFIVLPSSKLVILGKTNVNSFQCATQYCGRDTLVLREGGANNQPFFEKGKVGLDAAAFDCGMAMMTRDFNQTIKAKTYPSIEINFISFERSPVLGCGEDQFKGRIKIALAGVARTFDVDCSIEAKSNGNIYLNGARKFQFGDFNLKAPSHMLGAIKVEETLEVRFNLVLRLDENC
ncbi:MAG: YceI family protein [Cyclobacteriaceae bacterium]|nr:YceI family protein [Cyclobacteriaceae bacterium]